MRDWQKGSTLIEQIVIISVVGLILPALGGIFFQTFMGPVQNSAQLAVAQDVQLSGDWISRDLVAGPMGNNLGLSGSSPSLASVTIGSSPGFPGNNSLTISYHTWPTADSTTPDDHTITYRLEDMDPTDDDIQLVRREETGPPIVVAKHIFDASHAVFSGSAQSSPGVASSGLNLNVTSTLEGSTGTVSRQASFVFNLPRSYEPTPSPTPSSQIWNVAVPYWLASKTGYWLIIDTKGTGTISANWQLASPAAIQALVYQGQPLGTPLGDSVITPTKVNATVLANNSATTNNLTATTASAQPAAKYMVYFYNGSNDYTNTTAATVTYVSP